MKLNISQKTLMKKFTKKNSLTRQMLFRNICSNFLYMRKIFDEVAVGSWFLFEVIMLIYL